jgi:hypothetical protein
VATQAWQDVKELSRVLDARDGNQMRPVNHLEQLQFRRWLLHWALFVTVCFTVFYSLPSLSGDMRVFLMYILGVTVPLLFLL